MYILFMLLIKLCCIDANWQNDRRIKQGTTPNSLKMRTMEDHKYKLM